MIKETAYIYLSEDELNYLIGIVSDEKHQLYSRLIEARKNIFRY
jgi:hypothetical protein